MKKVKVLSASLMLLVLLGACGSKGSDEKQASDKSVAGEYTIFYSTEELGGNTAHNGFVTGLGLSQKNTVTLNEDNTYEYTKELSVFNDEQMSEDNSVDVVYTFNGDYESEGDKVTLSAPSDVTFDENWAILSESGHLASTKGTSKDKVVPKEGEEYNPLDAFLTPYYSYSATNDSTVVITVNQSDNTFEYNEAVSSDDE